jgi:hypothetical protein
MIKLSATLAVGVLLLVNPSPAHQSWISQEGATNPVTANGAAARATAALSCRRQSPPPPVGPSMARKLSTMTVAACASTGLCRMMKRAVNWRVLLALPQPRRHLL